MMSKVMLIIGTANRQTGYQFQNMHSNILYLNLLSLTRFSHQHTCTSITACSVKLSYKVTGWARVSMRAGGTQSTDTSVDSDTGEGVESDIEYSRVIAPPEAVRSMPESSSTPRKDLKDTQQTQPVVPLSGTQLRAIMGDGEEEETRDDLTANSPIPEGHSEHILSTSDNSDEEAEMDPRPKETAKEDVINSSPRSVRRIDGNFGPLASLSANKSLEIIDETPLKLLSMAPAQTPYVYLLAKWSKEWWPCRGDRRDYEANNTKSRVLFRKEELGDVDLRDKAFVYELLPQDTVHIANRPSRTKYEVVGCAVSAFFPGNVTTNDGFNLVKVRNCDHPEDEFAIAAEDIYFTANDMQNWKNRRADQYGQVVQRAVPRNMSPVTPVNNGKRRSAAREPNPVSPRKRRAETPIEYPSSPVTSPHRGSSPRILSQDYALQSSPVTSPTRRTRNRFPRPSSSANKTLFSSCIFSISTRESHSFKQRARDLLVDHGGKVLDDGLSEIVSLTDSSESGSMPDHECDFGNATFAAVLADEPRRTSKYLEMVALGWPCLSIAYMYDCLEANELLDWRSYLLPAGESNLIGKKMTVSANASAFHARWLRGASLTEQFQCRKVIFRCTVPLCIAGSVESFKSRLVLLASFCAPRFKLWFYGSKRDVPGGSVLLELKPTSTSVRDVRRTDPVLLDQIQNYAAAETTVAKNTEWMIQCIINGGMV